MVNETLLLLQKANKEHTVKTSPSSTIIIVGGKTHYFNNSAEKTDAKYLSFIKKARRQILENIGKVGNYRPDYFGFSSISKTETLYDCAEIDIKGAYWQTGYLLGIIPEQIYREGLEVPKKIRLISLGSIASTKNVLKWSAENRDYEILPDEYSEKGRRAFFKIAHEVGRVIKTCLEDLPGMFVFFWVDAIFAHKMYEPYIRERLEKQGYEVTLKDINYIEKIPGDNKKSGRIICNMSDGSIKVFNEPKQKIKKIIQKF